MTKLDQIARKIAGRSGIPFDQQPAWVQDQARELAGIAIETLRQPDDSMLRAGYNVEFAMRDGTDAATAKIWSAMLGAAA